MSHPYAALSSTHFWNRAVAIPGTHEVDPMVSAPFTITAADKVATIGSCFAQHLSAHLQRSGLNYFVAEQGPPAMTNDERRAMGYGVFSARYGNVYTVRQAVQLFDRAYGFWDSAEEPWRLGERWVDPFRPRVEPNGFPTQQLLMEDRERHLAAVREVIDQSAVLVFTLGLTEGWRSRADGSMFPLVPGTAGGEFAWENYEFVNFTAAEVTADLTRFAERVCAVNPSIQILLTVSPVPLIATYSDEHVLTATAYSKAVLRVAAADVAQEMGSVSYFPSYEVVTSASAGNRYFAPDLRSVTEEGVAHVMRVFSRHYVDGDDGSSADSSPGGQLQSEIESVSGVVCDEEVLGHSA